VGERKGSEAAKYQGGLSAQLVAIWSDPLLVDSFSLWN
jgi:hypothetical protein